MSGRSVLFRHAAAVALACLALQASAQSATGAVEAGMAPAKMRFSEGLKALKRLESELKDAQAALRARDEAVDGADASTMADRVAAAAEAARVEAGLRDDLDNARAELGKARSALFAALRPAREVVRPLAAGDAKDVDDTIKQAKEAQATVAALKANAEQAFKRSDAAVVNALEYAQTVSSAALKQEEGNAKARDALKAASDAHANALKAYETVPGAQRLANGIVESALAVVSCDLGGDCSKLPAQQRQLLAADLLNLKEKKQRSVQALKQAKQASFRVDPEVLALDGDKKEWALQALDFIDRNPDARALFGAEAARLSANGSGAKATIRLDLDKRSGGLLKDTALVLSTPLAKDGPTSVVSSPDGFPSDTWLSFSRAVMRPSFTQASPTAAGSTEAPTVGRWLQLGWSVGVGYKSFDVASEDLTSTKMTTHKRAPWTLGGHVVLVANETASHQLSANFGHDFKAGKIQQRCPTLPAPDQTYLLCKSGVFSGPSEEEVRRLGYNYRREGTLLGMSPTLTYDFEARQSSFEFPLYFIRDASAKGTPLTAGISFAFQSKTKDADSKASRVWSLFVTAPLSLLGE